MRSPLRLAGPLALLAASSLSACVPFVNCPSQRCHDDQQVNRDVTAALGEDKEFLPGSIYPRTYRRVVYLYGIAETNVERLRAEAIARRTQGVDGVVDLVGLVNR